MTTNRQHQPPSKTDVYTSTYLTKSTWRDGVGTVPEYDRQHERTTRNGSLFSSLSGLKSVLTRNRTSGECLWRGRIIWEQITPGGDLRKPEVAMPCPCDPDYVEIDFANYVNGLDFALDRNAWSAGSSRLQALFMGDVARNLGLSGHPKVEVLMRMAWERGHSSGYQSVYSEASELAELLS